MHQICGGLLIGLIWVNWIISVFIHRGISSYYCTGSVLEPVSILGLSEKERAYFQISPLLPICYTFLSPRIVSACLLLCFVFSTRRESHLLTMGFYRSIKSRNANPGPENAPAGSARKAASVFPLTGI